MYVHVHRAGKILCCSIMNWHQCPAIILSPFPVLTPTCRGWATGPAETWATAGRPGLFFSEIYFVILYNQIYPPRPWRLIGSTDWKLSLPWTLSPTGKRNEEVNLPGPWLLLCVGPRFVLSIPCMTQMPSGPFLYSLYPVCVWVEALPDIKGRIWRDTALVVSISWVVTTQYPPQV